MMHPSLKNSHSFLFPADRLLKLWGTIEEDEMRKPKMYDQNGDACIIVLKRGRTTGLTVGRATTFVSYTRKYVSDNNTAVSKELMILSFDQSSGVFSAKGDSGSAVVDGAGRVVGILTGDGGATDSTLPMSHPYPLSWRLSAATSPSPMLISSRSSPPRRGDESMGWLSVETAALAG
jgi:hypothetical protein